MDKFMNNRWFMRIIALLLALMLYMSVYIQEQKEQSDGSLTLPLFDDSTEILEDIPVEVLYDQERFVVTGAPQSADVRLEGPTSKVKTIIALRNIKVYANLENKSEGNYLVTLEYENVDDKVNVTFEPTSRYEVALHEKVTQEFAIKVDYNESLVTEGYTVENLVPEPTIVSITGAKEEVERTAIVRAYIDLQDVIDDVTLESSVTVHDKDGQPLNVEVEPANISVGVSIISPNKVVPLNFIEEGTLQGIYIKNIEMVPDKVTVYGPKNVIDSITKDDVIDIPIDLNSITKDEEIIIPIKVPEGATKIDPVEVKVAIDVEEEVTETFTDIPIVSEGLGEGLALSFSDLENGALDITVTGRKSSIENISNSNIKVTIDVANLPVGDYEVPVEVSILNEEGIEPVDISLEIPIENVKVNISGIE
ncbi:YbbR-like domain-containing protein [Bacillus sp. SCS-151]|uniref:CdaR family protein n=1 Tax=Nanhaiella sioensis TaxID=3115293 RepID=UPI00397E3C61